MNEPINVGLGMRAVSRNPEDILVAYGLGSCMGVVMIDPVIKAAGLLHAVLPTVTDGLKANEEGQNDSKYVESGIESLVAAMVKEGAVKSRFLVYLVGGANMLMYTYVTKTFSIGMRNIEASYATLSRLKIPVTAADVGGQAGRTVRVYVADSRVTVRAVGQKEHQI